MIEDLLGVLANAGVDPDSGELRDALWLATHINVPHTDSPPAPALTVSAEPAVTEPEAESESGDLPSAPEPGQPERPAGLLVGGPSAPPRLLGRPAERVRGITVRSPHTARPARQIEVARALRPFGRRVPARGRFVLDENATVARIAEEGVWSPVLRPATERWLDLAIVVDPSPTMAIWARQVRQFRAMTERLGLFRLIREHKIGRVQAEPAHRQAVLLITDGVSTDWQTGRMHTILETWATTRPVAVCDLLPPHMWPGTGVRVVPDRARSWKPGAANRDWSVHNGPSAIPVVRLSPPWLGSWARLVAGSPGWTPIALLGQPLPPDTAVLGPREQVEKFRLAASPQAFRLACLLAAAWLTLPVMRLVRDLMLPGADDGDLAQFFLGDLLVRSSPGELALDSDQVRYDFLPGVREHLVDHLQRRDLITVVQQTNKFVASRYGEGVDVAALLADPENALRGKAAIEPGSPLYIAAVVLARLGGRYRALKAAMADHRTAAAPERFTGLTEPRPTIEEIPPVVPTVPRMLANRYELGDPIGNGRMADIHQGRDIRLGRTVAIKLLRPDLALDSLYQERFRREAQNVAALNYPAIVAVYDTGETRTENGPLPFIVMEYVDGRDLDAIIRAEGPLPGQRAVEIMADVCAALDFSHRHGIVHRDVKPANVMITKTGAVKVMDFGIARAVYDGQAAITPTATAIGTTQYFSPEQARGEAVDSRSDVYSIGCTLFTLVTGQPPFNGASPVAVAYQHIRQQPPKPSRLNPRVSPQLDAIVVKAMAKSPPDRYQSAAEMRMDLVRFLSGTKVAAPLDRLPDITEEAEPPEPSRWQRRFGRLRRPRQ